MSKPALTRCLASPRGFCACLIAPSRSSSRAIERFGAPVYVRH